MNWNCVVCDDAFALKPRQSANSYGTFGDGQDVKFICPDHVQAVSEFIAKLRAEVKEEKPVLIGD